MSIFYPLGIPNAMSLVGFNSLLTGFLIMLKKKDHAGIRYFIFSFFVFAWGISISFMLNNDLPFAIVNFWGRLTNASALLIPVSWLHFVAVYTEKTERVKVLLLLIYMITFAVLPFSFGNSFVAGFRPMVGFNYYPIPGILYHVFTALFFLTVLSSVNLTQHLWDKIPARSCDEKNKRSKV